MRILASILAVAALALVASPARALIGLNQCGPGTGPPTGMHCNHDELLLGFRDATGACVWTCCRPNSDGHTYNCTGPTTPSDKLDLSNVRPKAWPGQFTPGKAFEKPATAATPGKGSTVTK